MSMCNENDVKVWVVRSDSMEVIVNALDDTLRLVVADNVTKKVVAVELSEQACEQLAHILVQARMQAAKQIQIECVNKLRDLSAAHIRDIQAKEAQAPDKKEGEYADNRTATS